MKNTVLFVFLFAFGFNAVAQQSINLMFYNTENLFDTINDPNTKDDDFTPKGELSYSSERYYQKLGNLAQVINKADSSLGISLIGLCEVENQTVVDELASKLSIVKAEVIHYESQDERGIDNAIIYSQKALKLLDSGIQEIELGENERPTRPILYAIFQPAHSNEKLIVLVNHWPSRSGGQAASEPKRILAAEQCAKLITKLSLANEKAMFVVMGDLNDTPMDSSVLILERCDDDSAPCLTNLFKPMHESGSGTHAYKSEWAVLDQMLVSENLISKKTSGFYTSSDFAQTFSFPSMYYTSTDSKDYPARTFSGSKYFGGYSDHLPIILQLKENK